VIVIRKIAFGEVIVSSSHSMMRFYFYVQARKPLVTPKIFSENLFYRIQGFGRKNNFW
jgi:hypothetical protein